jgi:hypothetical protein
MLGAAAPYVVAISAMLFAGISALALIYTVTHLDPPETVASPTRADERVTV